jgi:hypothetical protein
MVTGQNMNQSVGGYAAQVALGMVIASLLLVVMTVTATLVLALWPLRSASYATIVVCTGLGYAATIGLIVLRVRPNSGFRNGLLVGGAAMLLLNTQCYGTFSA